jgi:hypothetical protein
MRAAAVLRLVPFAVLLASGTSGCRSAGAPSDPGGTLEIAVAPISGGQPLNIGAVFVNLYGMTSHSTYFSRWYQLALDAGGTRYTTEITQIPPGSYHIKGVAYVDPNADPTLPPPDPQYETPDMLNVGPDPSVVILPNRIVSATMTLQQNPEIWPPQTYVNAAPVISSLVLSTWLVDDPSASPVTIDFDAYDLDDEALEFVITASDSVNSGTDWSAYVAPSAGPYSGHTQATFTPPSSFEGDVYFELSVRDPKQARTVLPFFVRVSHVHTTLDVTVYLNNTPDVLDIQAAPPQLRPGATTQITVDARDPDGDLVHYHWAARCGTIEDLDAPTVTFTAPPFPATCSIDVEAYDGKGGDNFSTLALVVSDAMALAPPAFTTVDETTLPSGLFSFTALAQELNGDSLTDAFAYTWQASDAYGFPLPDTFIRSTPTFPPSPFPPGTIEWAAPCVGAGTADYQVYANAFGLNGAATYVFPAQVTTPDCTGCGAICAGACTDLTPAMEDLADLVVSTATTQCIPESTIQLGILGDTTVCAAQTCGGSAGCTASFDWHPIAIDPVAGQVTLTVDVSTTIDVQLFGCSMTFSGPVVATAPVQLAPLVGAEKVAFPGPTSVDVSGVTSSGCGLVGDLVAFLRPFVLDAYVEAFIAGELTVVESQLQGPFACR